MVSTMYDFGVKHIPCYYPVKNARKKDLGKRGETTHWATFLGNKEFSK